MSEIRRTRLVVPGMYCEGCAETIRDALGATAGVREVSVDVERRELTIAWGPEHTSEDAIRSRLAAAGFHARSSDDAAGEEPAPRALFGRVAALVLGLLAAGGVGYAGYEAYPRFDLPAVDLGPLLLLAVGAGVASFFSPCAFALLATLLGRELHEAPEERPGLRRAVVFAGAMAAGAAAFVLVLGSVIAWGGGALVGSVTFTSGAGRLLRLGVGLVLILLGAVQLGLLPSPLHPIERIAKPLMRAAQRPREARSFAAFFLFGFGYLIAGFG